MDNRFRDGVVADNMAVTRDVRGMTTEYGNNAQEDGESAALVVVEAGEVLMKTEKLLMKLKK